jgi:hypothetical protein
MRYHLEKTYRVEEILHNFLTFSLGGWDWLVFSSSPIYSSGKAALNRRLRWSFSYCVRCGEEENPNASVKNITNGIQLVMK